MSSVFLAALVILGGEVEGFHQPNLCGPIALYGVCAHHGLDTAIDQLASRSGYDGRGVSVRGLVVAAESVGLKAEPLNSSITHVKRMTGPAIVDYPKGHFCLYFGWSDGQAVLYDYPEGRLTVPSSEFEERWGGHVILFHKASTEDE